MTRLSKVLMHPRYSILRPIPFMEVVMFSQLLQFLLKINQNKPQCGYGLTVFKCPISSLTIKCRSRFKSNPKTNLHKPQCRYGFTVCQTIKYMYKFKSNQQKKDVPMDPAKVCTKFQVSSTSII